MALRHDACFNPYLAVKMPSNKIKYGIKSSYYLTISNAYDILKQIGTFQELENLGYEIGYHYDDVGKCDTKTVTGCVIDSFKTNLAFLHHYFDVRSATPLTAAN